MLPDMYLLNPLKSFSQLQFLDTKIYVHLLFNH